MLQILIKVYHLPKYTLTSPTYRRKIQVSKQPNFSTNKEFSAPVLRQRLTVQSLRPSPVPERRWHSDREAALIKLFSGSLKTLTATEGDQNGSPPADRQWVAQTFSGVCSEVQSGTFPPVAFSPITVTSPQKKILLTRWWFRYRSYPHITAVWCSHSQGPLQSRGTNPFRGCKWPTESGVWFLSP